MKSRTISLTISIGIAIMAILASKALFDTHPRAFMHNVLHTIKAISYSAITSVYSHHHHHHHHHHRKPSDTKKKVDICDDFPKNIPPPDTDTTSYLCVDKKGCCNFTTVQSAVDAIGNFSQKRNVIWINSGMYYEKVVIPKTKPNITLQGQGFDTTAIAWNDTAYSANGTFYCATVQVFGSQFVAKNISFMNVAPIPKPGDVGAQAVAIRIGGDQSAFLGCGFFGAQDTLHDDRGRHYFKNCYIQGSIDFIFGNAKSLYQWVVQRGVWHVDDCLLFVSPWKTSNSLKIPEVSTIPVWVTLKNVPDCCYSRLGLSHVASGLGEPMQTHKPRLDPTSLGEAKLLVEVELDKPFPKQIALDDKQGNIFLVDVEYTWIPSVCGRCGHLGHKEKRCLLPAVQVKTSMQEGPSKEALGAEPDEEQSQVNAASDQEVVQIENSEVSLILPENPKGVYAEQILGSTNEIEKLQSQKSAELRVLSTPANTPTHSKVTVAIGSNSQSISSPLAGEKSAPVKSLTMEKAPSNIIVSDRQASADDHLICSPNAKTPENQHPDHDTMCYDHATGFVIGDSSTSFGLTRSGRPIKPTQKFKIWNGILWEGGENAVVAVDIVHLTSYAISISCCSRLNALLLGHKATS